MSTEHAEWMTRNAAQLALREEHERAAGIQRCPRCGALLPAAMCGRCRYQPRPARLAQDSKFYFWKFVHNALIHPCMSLPWEEPRWLIRAHDWTAKRCWGAG